MNFWNVEETCLRKKRLRICMMLLYSIVDDYGVCDRDGVGDAVASVWLIADALNGGGVWLIADASVWLIDDACPPAPCLCTTVHNCRHNCAHTCPSSPHACAQMYTFVCTTVRNIAPPSPCLCSSAHNCVRNCAQEWPHPPHGCAPMSEL